MQQIHTIIDMIRASSRIARPTAKATVLIEILGSRLAILPDASNM